MSAQARAGQNVPSADIETRREEAPSAGQPASQPTPFIVEEIEAEFARLLGRSVDKKN